MFCYVANESELAQSTLDDKVKRYIAEQTKAAAAEKKHSYWIRLSNDDRYKYQWLPSEFEVTRGSDGKSVESVNILSYINKLDRSQHGALYALIACIFGKMVPMFDEVF